MYLYQIETRAEGPVKVNASGFEVVGPFVHFYGSGNAVVGLHASDDVLALSRIALLGGSAEGGEETLAEKADRIYALHKCGDLTLDEARSALGYSETQRRRMADADREAG